MNSKEALENVKIAPTFMGGNPRYWTYLNSQFPFLEDIEIIKQDLDKLEKLEKALDKACELLADYTGSCPREEELVEDLDCDECDNNCKECWKKYFMRDGV